MANLLSIKRRINASQNVAKTTRAMQMIAASKLKRAQDAATSGKPYIELLVTLAQNLTKKLGENTPHPYMQKPKCPAKTLFLLFAPDKSLCGGLITNLIRKLFAIDSEFQNASYLTIGKKLESSVAHLKKEIVASFSFGTTLPSFDMVYPITSLVDNQFLKEKVTGVKILTTNFLNVFSQTPKIINLLPIEIAPEANKPQNKNRFTLFEPKPQDLLPTLLKHYLEMTIYQYLLESYASEQAARMIAMQNATDNALEITKELELEYNKKRQEKITNEILDISSHTFAYANA